MTPRLSLESVTFAYDDTPAVDRLSLAVAPGESLCLLGPSGSGKSTTLALVAGFLTPGAGMIRIDGRPVTRTPAHRRNLGVVFQEPQLLPHLSVAGNVALPLALRGAGKAECRAAAERLLALVRLRGLADRDVETLSGGQAQRVALARALAGAPRALLLDEPFGALDRRLREDMQQELRALQRALDLSMLYVTHDQDEAMTVADRIAVLDDGSVRQLGAPQDIHDAPADAFVANFFGENNRLAGRVESLEDDMAWVRLGTGALVEARPVGVGPGHRCVLTVRPERIAIAAARADEMGDDALPATLRDITLRGDHVRLTLALGEETLLVKRPAGVPLAGMRPGAELAVAWPGHHARAFRPEPGS